MSQLYREPFPAAFKTSLLTRPEGKPGVATRGRTYKSIETAGHKLPRVCTPGQFPGAVQDGPPSSVSKFGRKNDKGIPSSWWRATRKHRENARMLRKYEKLPLSSSLGKENPYQKTRKPCNTDLNSLITSWASGALEDPERFRQNPFLVLESNVTNEIEETRVEGHWYDGDLRRCFGTYAREGIRRDRRNFRAKPWIWQELSDTRSLVDDSEDGNAQDEEEEAPTACCRQERLGKLALDCCTLLSSSFQVNFDRQSLPTAVVCGKLRNTVRAAFTDLSPEAELSVKTAQKLERGRCQYCKSIPSTAGVDWLTARQVFQPSDPDHIERFARFAAVNIRSGWNAAQYPYIPNGSATFNNTRMRGGNWNAEEFDDRCLVLPILSNGKPRVVTLYSEFNSRTLMPLHTALYRSLAKSNWILIGDPNEGHLQQMKGGDWVSVDYASATDNIKLAYVRRLVDVLIAKASPPLNHDQIKCLRVLGELKPGDPDDGHYLDQPPGKECYSGQPMGSYMSFPMLCLVNKIVTDLALADMADEGCITSRTYTTHRVLINGDDLLTREPVPKPVGKENPYKKTQKPCNTASKKNGTSYLDRIAHHGSMIGLVVNREKTMVDPEVAEINSTCFRNGVLQKKLNLNALNIKPECEDVLGYAQLSARTPADFICFVRRNCHILAKQDDKNTRCLTRQNRMMLRDRKVLKALTSLPDKKRMEPPNLFPVVELPDGYDLEREQEVQVITARVEAIRALGLSKPRGDKIKRRAVPNAVSLYCVLKPKRAVTREMKLKCLVDKWNERRWGELCSDDETAGGQGYCPDVVKGDGESIINHSLRIIAEFKASRCAYPKAAVCGSPASDRDYSLPEETKEMDYLKIEWENFSDDGSGYPQG